MSTEAIRFYRGMSERVPRAHRALALAIATYVGPKGECCTANLRTLASDAGVGFSKARESAAALEALGIIARARTVKADGRSGVGYAISFVGFPEQVPCGDTRSGRASKCDEHDLHAGCGSRSAAKPRSAVGGPSAGPSAENERAYRETLETNTPPYPPASGGNSAGLDQVNKEDRPHVERLRNAGRHLAAIDGLIVPLLAKVRLSAADKAGELAAIAAEADGLTDEELAKAVADVVAAGSKRVKAALVCKAVQTVRASGACVVLHPGTPRWEAWAAYDRARGVKFPWWERAVPWTALSAMPPSAARPAEVVT